MSVTLSAGETVTCTFTNTQRGAATALKLVAPDGAPGDFTFVLTPLPAGDAVVSDPVAGGGQADFPNLVPGRYQLAEQQPTTGFDLTDLTCDPESAVVSIDVDSATAVIDIGPGQTVTCTFTNTQRGSITVAKETLPDGSAQTFEFSPSWGPAFSLADGQSNTSDLLVPGEYSVGETVPEGWDLTSATCDDGSDPAQIGLDPGETVTCTFTNTQRGSILVGKQTLPDGSAQTFEFSPSWGDAFTLADGQSNDSGLLEPGQYSVGETVPEGWDLASATCDDGSDPTAIVLDPGENVVCSFINAQRGRILVDKVTDPPGSAQEFEFNPSWSDDNFTLTGGADPADSGLLLPGRTYSVVELDTPGWDLTEATCTGGRNPVSVTLSAGETVTCTFTNTQRGSILVGKQTLPDGSAQTFEFSPSWGDAFTLADGQSNDSGLLEPGPVLGGRDGAGGLGPGLGDVR